MPTEPLTLRRGGPDDEPWLLERFDEAVAWMVARGQEGQWGTEPPSSTERGRQWIAGMCAEPGLRIASVGDAALGALIVGDHPAHVAPVDEPEMYIELLIVARGHGHRGIGPWLVECARAEARAAGLGLVRVDCWAGAPSLVAWYEAQGFTRAGTFTVQSRGEPWTGQVFEMRLAPAAPESPAA